MFKTIRQAIVDVLNDEYQVTKLYAAYRTPRANVEGFPVAVVTPSDRQADYGSTGSQDKLTFNFIVAVYAPLTDESNREAEELMLEEAVDEVLTVFSNRAILAEACDWVAPVVGAWQEVTIADGIYLRAEITLACIKYQN